MTQVLALITSIVFAAVFVRIASTLGTWLALSSLFFAMTAGIMTARG